MLPSTFLSLDSQEKAFIIACIDLKIEADKKQMKKAQRKRGG